MTYTETVNRLLNGEKVHFNPKYDFESYEKEQRYLLQEFIKIRWKYHALSSDDGYGNTTSLQWIPRKKNSKKKDLQKAANNNKEYSDYLSKHECDLEPHIAALL